MVGFDDQTGHKLLLTAALLLVLAALRWAAARLIGRVHVPPATSSRRRFWAQQAASLVVAVIALLGLLSIWFDNPRNLTAAMGLVTAGLASRCRR